MKIRFSLTWKQTPRIGGEAFKDKNAFAVFSEYFKRISHFCPCEAGGWNQKRAAAEPGKKIWVCDRSGKEISSDELAKILQKVMDSGARELEIVIGGPDGLNKTEIENLKPQLIWSFGRLTLPHELAAVVASEQIYRAWTILRNLPYHVAH
ncbi:MAG: 23S rRNA (pseudouridine(1915)-N(3))-methyltransferase RlmH [Candidatus Omnitrophica bacterium]|nr:23S rRNA (pseudouridine(1915)-N(3))-methyltransferase RlmH [Candidatus Omnitrophota bacterium]